MYVSVVYFNNRSHRHSYEIQVSHVLMDAACVHIVHLRLYTCTYLYSTNSNCGYKVINDNEGIYYESN